MLTIQKITCLLSLICVVTLITGGCISPSPTPAPCPTPDPAGQTPEKAVIGFWSDIDSGRYADAYGLSYHDRNASYEDWVGEHEATYGANGSYLEIYSFNVTESFPVSPDTFEGSFSAAQVIVVDTKMAYNGENRTGTVQFPVVRTAGVWKVYGDY